MTDPALKLAWRVALDVGAGDATEVLRVVRRKHGVLFTRFDEMTSDEYEELCEAVADELIYGHPGSRG